jgi:hypothetical protein
MPLPDRYIAHPPPGASSLFKGEHPLGAGRVNMHLAHNARLVALRNSRRPLAQIPGWRSLYAPAWRGTSYTDSPAVGDIRWDLRSGTSGGANARLGTHFIWPEAYRGILPRLRLRFRVRAPATFTVGVLLAVGPGQVTSPLLATSSVGNAYTNTSFADGVLTLALAPGDVQALEARPIPGDATGALEESGGLLVFTAWAGAYCSSGNGGNVGDVLGISLGLEPSS